MLKIPRSHTAGWFVGVTVHAFIRAGWTIMIPITPPRKMFPPKTLAAETATRTGSSAKAVLATMSRKPNHPLSAKDGIAFASASTRPIIRPEATMAGRIGTNTSPGVFRIFFHRGILEAAAFFTSSLDAAETPATERNSSYTLLTVPVPMISCS